MSGLLRQASLEKIGSSRIGNFAPSGSKSRLGNYALGNTSQEGRIISPEERLLVGVLCVLCVLIKVVDKSNHSFVIVIET